MTNASTMLDLRPPRVAIDPQLQADTIDVLVEAARTARQCADACLQEPAPPRRCIALNLDAADLCEAVVGVLIRMSEPPATVVCLDAARAVLAACEQECRQHGAHLRQCVVCADVCARAEELCVRMTAALRPTAPTPDGEHASPSPALQDPLSPGAAMGTSGAAPEPNEPA